MLMCVENSLSSCVAKLSMHRAVKSNSCNVWTVRLSCELVQPGRLSKNLSIEITENKILRSDGAPNDAIRECQKCIFILKAKTEMSVTAFMDTLPVEGPIAEPELLSQMFLLFSDGHFFLIIGFRGFATSFNLESIVDPMILASCSV